MEPVAGVISNQINPEPIIIADPNSEEKSTPSIINRILRCFNCLKKPKTLLTFGCTLLGAGAISTGLSFAPPSLMLAPILLPLGIVLIGTGLTLSAVGLAIKAYKNIKNKRKDSENQPPVDPNYERFKTQASPETMRWFRAAQNEMEQITNKIKGLYEKSEKENYNISNLISLKSLCELKLTTSEQLLQKLLEIAEVVKTSDEIKKIIASCQASHQIIIDSCNNIQIKIDDTKKSEIRLLERLTRLEKMSRAELYKAKQARLDAQNNLIRPKDAIIICQKALSVTNNAYDRAFSQAKFARLPASTESYIDSLFNHRQDIAQELENASKGIDISDLSKGLLATSFNQDLDTRFTGLPKITKVSLNELKIDDVSQAEFEDLQKNADTLHSYFFVANKDAISNELFELNSDKLSQLFTLVKHYLPQTAELSFEKTLFFADLLKLMGAKPSFIAFYPIADSAKQKYRKLGWIFHSCCSLSIDNKTFVMDFLQDEILELEDHQDNQEPLFQIKHFSYDFYINPHLKTERNIFTDFRTALEKELSQKHHLNFN